MSDALFAIQTARKLGPALRETPYAKPIAAQGVKMHTGPIRSQVAGRTDHLPNHVPSGSYVIPADVVSGLGEGNTEAGFKVLRRMFSGVPYGGEGVPYGGNDGPYGERIGHARGGKTHHRHHSEEFRRWFGKSKAVDNNGLPKVYYHGTARDFDVFSHDYAGTGSGDSRQRAFFFSDDPSTASHYAEVQGAGYGTDDPSAQHAGAVMPVFLRAENPFVSKEKYYNTERFAREIDRAKKAGHDSISFPNVNSRGENGVIAVFDPGQIKSSIGNHGLFNKNDPDITKSSGGSVAAPVPCVLAGGEHVLAPHEVAFAGGGDVEAGHRALDEFVKQYRAKTVKTLKGLPGPRRD